MKKTGSPGSSASSTNAGNNCPCRCPYGFHRPASAMHAPLHEADSWVTLLDEQPHERIAADAEREPGEEGRPPGIAGPRGRPRSAGEDHAETDERHGEGALGRRGEAARVEAQVEEARDRAGDRDGGGHPHRLRVVLPARVGNPPSRGQAVPGAYSTGSGVRPLRAPAALCYSAVRPCPRHETGRAGGELRGPVRRPGRENGCAALADEGARRPVRFAGISVFEAL